MRNSKVFIIIAVIFVVASYAEYMICEHFYRTDRYNECYIIKADSDYLQKLVDAGKSKNGFRKFPRLVTVPQKIINKYHFEQVEDACFDNIQCGNYIFHFDCAKSRDMYYLVLRDYHIIGEPKLSYALHDGRNNVIKTVSAIHTFEKKVLSNLGSYNTDLTKRFTCLYAELFFWNQIYIYFIIIVSWILLIVVERIKNRDGLTS